MIVIDTEVGEVSTPAEAQAAYEARGHKGKLQKLSRDGEPTLWYNLCPACSKAAAWEPETAARKGWPAFNGPATRCRCNGEHGDGK